MALLFLGTIMLSARHTILNNPNVLNRRIHVFSLRVYT